jgi:putative DNA primase/helicase
MSLEELGTLRSVRDVFGDPSSENNPDGHRDAWPEPQPLPSGLLPVPALPDILLPEALRPWLSDITERTQCPIEYPAIGAIVALSSVIGRSCGIRPKRQDDWLCVPNLWGAIVGPPGVLKSPSLREPMRPLELLAKSAREHYENELAAFAFDEIVCDAKKHQLQEEVRKVLKADGDPDSLREKLEDAELVSPRLKRYIVNDTTVEKLGELLNQSERGLLLFRDELTGFLRGLSREGREADRAFYLEAWSGTGSFTYDRIKRGTIYIEAACLSVLGTIQPGPLREYLDGALRGGAGDDGLMQRFQLAVYPDVVGAWSNVDRWPNAKVRDDACALYHALAQADPRALGAREEDGEIPYFRFADDAQELFDEWRTDLESQLRRENEHPAIVSHLAKYRSLAPSLALIFHLVESIRTGVQGPVSLPALERAAAWCDLLAAHARRIYGSAVDTQAAVAKRIVQKLREGSISLPFSARDIYRREWSGMRHSEDVKAALTLLCELGWVRATELQAGTKVRVLYYAHPSVTR